MRSTGAENGSSRMVRSWPSRVCQDRLRITRLPSRTPRRSSYTPMTFECGATGFTRGVPDSSADFEQVGYNKWAGRAVNAPTLAPPSERCCVAKRICSIEGCERFVVARGLCEPHYRPLKNSGAPLPPRKRDLPPKVCAVEGCERRAQSRGWCVMHYERWVAHGDLAATRVYRVGGGPRLAENGYVYIFRPEHPLAHADGYVAQHRMVVYDAGIEVPDGYTVHHVNHNRVDNRLENLRVMTGSEHASHHIEERGTVTNQFGTFPVTDIASGRRVCTACGVEKPLSEFSLQRGRPYCWCKPCACIRSRKSANRSHVRIVKET
jgi:hypothetical protein